MKIGFVLILFEGETKLNKRNKKCLFKNQKRNKGKKKKMGNDQSSSQNKKQSGAEQQQQQQFPKTDPLMSASQRAKCLEVFNTQFKTNENFLRDAILLKLRMKGKLMKIRQKILSKKQQQQEQQGEETSNNSETDIASPTTQALLAAAPIPSFANCADAQAIQHKPTREEKIRDGCNLLNERIHNVLHVKMDVMADDGNCQFRAIAHQLYNGDQDGFHGKVRETVVEYMHKHEAEFNFLFEDEKEFNRYLGGMARARTWGDELTLKAAANAYNVNIHVLTSEKEHYYIVYRPDGNDCGDGDDQRKNSSSSNDSESIIDIFLAYISPIHYNSIRLVA